MAARKKKAQKSRKRPYRPIIRRSKAKTHPRGTTRREKSKATVRRRVTKIPKTKPSDKSIRKRRPKGRPLSIPRRGVSRGFRQFIRKPREGRREMGYVFVEMQFVYAGKRNRFIIPISLGEITPAEMRKIDSEAVMEIMEQTPSLERAEFVRIRGFAHRKPKSQRKGLSIVAKGHRRNGTRGIRSNAKTNKRTRPKPR